MGPRSCDIGGTGLAAREGESVDPEELREQLDVLPEHKRLFRRMLEMVARSGVLEETGDRFTVLLGPDDPLPEVLPSDLDEFATRMMGMYPDVSPRLACSGGRASPSATCFAGQEDPSRCCSAAENRRLPTFT